MNAHGCWSASRNMDGHDQRRHVISAERAAPGRDHGAAVFQFADRSLRGHRDQGKERRRRARTLALRLSDLVLKAALKPLEQGFGNFVSGLVSGAGSGLPRAARSGRHAGAVRVRRRDQSPIAFPLAGGRFGIAGERGAEAIMPLSRGPDGRLGIAARGGGGVSVTVNVHAQDAQSFLKSKPKWQPCSAAPSPSANATCK